MTTILFFHFFSPHLRIEGCRLEKSLHNLDTSPLSNMWFTNIFSWPVTLWFLFSFSSCYLFKKQLYRDRMDIQWTVFKVFSLTCFHICTRSWGYNYNQHEGPIDPSAPESVFMRLCHRPPTPHPLSACPHPQAPTALLSVPSVCISQASP